MITKITLINISISLYSYHFLSSFLLSFLPSFLHSSLPFSFLPSFLSLSLSPFLSLFLSPSLFLFLSFSFFFLQHNPLSTFQVYSTVLFTIVTMLHSPELILHNWKFVPFINIFLFPFPPCPNSLILLSASMSLTTLVFIHEIMQYLSFQVFHVA